MLRIQFPLIFIIFYWGIFADTTSQNDRGTLIVKVSPSHCTVILNNVKIGVGNVTIENLQPGIYQLTVGDGKKIKTKTVQIYPYLATNETIILDNLGATLATSLKYLLGKDYSIGSNFEAGFRFRNHYTFFEYTKSFTGHSQNGIYSGHVNFWTYNEQGEWINFKGMVRDNWESEITFEEFAFKYVYLGLLPNPYIKFGPGLKGGSLKIKKITEHWQTFTDSLNKEHVFAKQPFFSRDPLGKNYIGPMVRVQSNTKLIQFGIDYEYYIGNKPQHFLKTFIIYNINN